MAVTRIPYVRLEDNPQSDEDRLDMSTAEIGLTVRTTNCLEEHGVLTVRDLLGQSPADLLSIQNFGEKTLEEVYDALESAKFYRQGRGPAQSE